MGRLLLVVQLRALELHVVSGFPVMCALFQTLLVLQDEKIDTTSTRSGAAMAGGSVLA
jgi:hypothetical protein